MRRRIVYFLLTCICIILLTSCQKQNEEASKEDDDAIKLYYLNIEENDIVTTRKELELSDKPQEAVEQIIEELQKDDDSEELQYRKVIDGKQIVVQNITVSQEGEACLDFGSGYQQVSGSMEVMIRAAIVKSIVGLDTIHSVIFTIDNEPITDTEGIALGTMNDDTFLMDDEAVCTFVEEVDLYLSNPEGDGLIQYPLEIKTRNNDSLEKAAVEALKVNYDNETKASISAEVKINRINVIGNTCYVDFSSEILNSEVDINNDVRIYSIVNTLTSLSGISQVYITVEGKLAGEIEGAGSLDVPLDYDYSLVDEQ